MTDALGSATSEFVLLTLRSNASPRDSRRWRSRSSARRVSELTGIVAMPTGRAPRIARTQTALYVPPDGCRRSRSASGCATSTMTIRTGADTDGDGLIALVPVGSSSQAVLKPAA
jgi:hypothetical protein